MMHHVRPWQIFAQLGSDRDAHLTIPTARGRESQTIMALETLLLISVARVIQAKTILEIGTSHGYTALHLAMNTMAEITTVDRETQPRAYDFTSHAARITAIQADIFDLRFDQKFDMVFTDINYTGDTTTRAMQIAQSVQPQVIVTHDYDHPDLPHVKPILDKMGENPFNYMLHVEDSWLCFRFRDIDLYNKIVGLPARQGVVDVA